MKYTTYPHYWVNHLGFLIRKQLVEAFQHSGHKVSAEEWAVLLILQGNDGLAASQLSDQTLRDKTTISRLIDKMEAKGFVERIKDANDRRILRLHLSRHGRETFEQLAPLAQALIARSIEMIDPDALATTVLTLSRMAENLKRNPESEVGHDL